MRRRTGTRAVLVPLLATVARGVMTVPESTVPAGATTGTVEVTTLGGTLTSNTSFTVTPL